MTSKLEAQETVKREVLPMYEGFRVGEVFSVDEISWRKPNLYGVDLACAWIVYLERTELSGLEASTIAVLDRSTGKIRYHGDAGDVG